MIPTNRLIRRSLAPLALGALGACASLPIGVRDLVWRDVWGDRGPQVLARDYAWCAEALENRRSQLAVCMAYRGWTLHN